MSERTTDDGWRSKRPRTEEVPNYTPASMPRASYEKAYNDWYASVTDRIVTDVPRTRAGLLGMPTVMENSLREWVAEREAEGFKYGEKDTSGSLMEHLYVNSFRRTLGAGGFCLCEDVFVQLQHLLQEVRVFSEPLPVGHFDKSPLVRHENVVTIAKLIHVACSPYAETEDIHLVWRLFESAWCTDRGTWTCEKSLLAVLKSINHDYDKTVRFAENHDMEPPYNRRLL